MRAYGLATRTGPISFFPMHSAILHMGSTDHCDIVCVMGSTLDLSFLSPRSRPNLSARHLSSFTRADLPALTEFFFYGVGKYIEDLVTRINVPLLSHVCIAFFSQLLFDVSQLSSLAQVCCSSLSPLQRPLESLDIDHFYTQSQVWRDDLESIQWLELLQPLITVKNLYLSGKLALPLARALQELTREGATEVLPALQGIHIELYDELGPVRRILEPFIAARQLSGYPVVVNHTKRMPKVDRWYW